MSASILLTLTTVLAFVNTCSAVACPADIVNCCVLVFNTYPFGATVSLIVYVPTANLLIV